MDLRMLFALALAGLLAAPGALGTHMTSYATNPVEHDDQGRSNEPDGKRAGLYGAGVADCTIDVTGDRRCTPEDLARWPLGSPVDVVAPGCADEAGRQPSGLCGLREGVGTGVPLPGGVGVPPGPCALAAGQRRVGMLDVHQRVYLTTAVPGYGITEVNRKLEDAGFFAAERHLLATDGSDTMAGGVGMLAWYGLFLDKNCNGVIDTWGSEQADSRNEFTWIGACLPFGGNQVVVPPDVCLPAPTEFLGWEVPGNHHASFGGACVLHCVFAPADMPGALVLCDLSVAAGVSAGDCDALEAGQNGDPLFGVQDSSAPDWYFYDYTGDPDVTLRTYVAAPNWPMYHYDPSYVVTTTVIGAVNPPFLGADTYDLAGSQFVDVDVLKSRLPQVEAYLQGLVKPTLRSTWLTLREAL